MSGSLRLAEIKVLEAESRCLLAQAMIDRAAAMAELDVQRQTAQDHDFDLEDEVERAQEAQAAREKAAQEAQEAQAVRELRAAQEAQEAQAAQEAQEAQAAQEAQEAQAAQEEDDSFDDADEDEAAQEAQAQAAREAQAAQARASKLRRAIKRYEILIRTTVKNPLHTKFILVQHARSMGIRTTGKLKEDLIKEMTALIHEGRTASIPVRMLHLYESRLLHVSCYDVRKETVEAHCDYYDIETAGLTLPLMWDALKTHLKPQRRL
jgi:DNA mismatch repair ATPase MutL